MRAGVHLERRGWSAAPGRSSLGVEARERVEAARHSAGVEQRLACRSPPRPSPTPRRRLPGWARGSACRKSRSGPTARRRRSRCAAADRRGRRSSARASARRRREAEHDQQPVARQPSHETHSRDAPRRSNGAARIVPHSGRSLAVMEPCEVGEAIQSRVRGPCVDADVSRRRADGDRVEDTCSKSEGHRILVDCGSSRG